MHAPPMVHGPQACDDREFDQFFCDPTLRRKLTPMLQALAFRLAIFARHVGQSTAACLTAMTQGDLSALTLQHWKVALTTGVSAGVLGILVSLGPLFRFYSDRWSVAAIAFFATVLADRWTHPTHFGGPWTEALVTGLAAAALSLMISYSPVGRIAEKMEKPEFKRGATRSDHE